MDLRKRAEGAAAGVFETLSASPTKVQADHVTKLIEQVIIDTLLDEGRRCAKVARDCGVADRDLAHKAAREIRLSNAALIANLSSLR